LLLPMPEPLIPPRMQAPVAGVTAACLAGVVIWAVAAGLFSGRLVDHEAPPQTPNRFTVNVNSATATELAQLPGLGPATAQRIVDHRAEHGAFSSLEALLDVPGIGEATLDQMRPHLRPIAPRNPEP